MEDKPALPHLISAMSRVASGGRTSGVRASLAHTFKSVQRIPLTAHTRPVHHCNCGILSGSPNVQQETHGNKRAYNDFEKQSSDSTCVLSLWLPNLRRKHEARKLKGTRALVWLGRRMEGVKRLPKGVNAFSRAGLGGGWEEEYQVQGAANQYHTCVPLHSR